MVELRNAAAPWHNNRRYNLELYTTLKKARDNQDSQLLMKWPPITRIHTYGRTPTLHQIIRSTCEMMAWENTLLVHLEQSDIVIIWSVILINKLQSVACFFISSCNQGFLVVQQAQFFFFWSPFSCKTSCNESPCTELYWRYVYVTSPSFVSHLRRRQLTNE